MSRNVRRCGRTLILLALLVGGFSLVSTVVLRDVATRLVRSAIDERAAAMGLDLGYEHLEVGLTGTIHLDGVSLEGTPLGDIAIPHIRFHLDLWRALGGELVFDWIRLERPHLRIGDDLVDPLCRQTRLCPVSPRVSVGAGSARARAGRPVRVPHTYRRSRAFMAAGLDFGRITIDGLRLEVSGRARGTEPYLAFYELDLELTPSWSHRIHLTGNGRLVSVFVGDDGVPFRVSGSLHRSEVGVQLEMEQAVAIDSPGASVSFEQIGFLVGEDAEVWLGKVVVLPRLLDFTDAWRAESVAATLSLRPGPTPEHVFVDGLKGQLDLVALNDLATWLAEEPDSAETRRDRELGTLRRALNDALAEIRGLLYGARVTVIADDGDIRLNYADGSGLSLASLNLDVAGRASLRPNELHLSYRAGDASSAGRRNERSGAVRLRIGDLTAAQIADWSRQ